MGNEDGDLYDEDLQYWFAGYQSEDGKYHNIQKTSRAVSYGDEIEVDWERWEGYNARNRNRLARAFENADIVNIGWIDKDGIVNYASLPGGVDLDYFDFETWVEDYG